ncbi:MAG: DUF503 domain-containing protein [Clostridiales bacterium]|nr:DUF503 domain-containing protein [Clostridiales bacterium]
MRVLLVTFSIYVPWVHSLKEKRSECKKLIHGLQKKFNASVVESGTQEIHQTITLSIATIVFNTAQLSKFEESFSKFIQQNTQGEILHQERDVF